MNIEEFRKCVESWVEAKPARSLRWLAAKAGVSYQSLWRFVSEKSANNLDFNLALSVASLVLDPKQAIQFLEDQFPNSSLALAKLGLSQASAAVPLAVDDVESFLSDAQSNNIYVLASNHNGTTRAKIAELYGAKGIEKLEQLLEVELLLEKAGEVRNPLQDFRFTALKDVLAQVQKVAATYDSSLRGTPAVGAGYLSQAVNKEALQKIKAKITQAVIECYEIASQTEMQGNIPIELGLCAHWAGILEV